MDPVIVIAWLISTGLGLWAVILWLVVGHRWLSEHPVRVDQRRVFAADVSPSRISGALLSDEAGETMTRMQANGYKLSAEDAAALAQWRTSKN